MMARILPCILLLTFFSNNLLAETYTREYTYNALPEDDKLTSRIIAVDQVRTLLLQKIGSHIQQTIEISEDGSVNSYARKDVEAVTASLTKIDILEEKWDEAGFYIKAKIEADTQPVLDALKKYKNDHSENTQHLLKALKLNEKELQKSREKIAHLKREMEYSKTSSSDTKTLTKYKTELNDLATEIIFSEGFEFHQRGEFAEAFKKYKKIAKQDNPVAQQLLGSLYMNGQGVKKDITKAIYWFQKAVEEDEEIAQYYLGIMYLKGVGIEQDLSKPAHWIHKSAEQGDALAQYQLGNMYLKGAGVEQKHFMAALWFRKAAEQRVSVAQLQLGKMYATGKGVAENNDEALYWYKKAANQGSNEARILIISLEKDNEK